MVLTLTILVFLVTIVVIAFFTFTPFSAIITLMALFAAIIVALQLEGVVILRQGAAKINMTAAVQSLI